MKIKSGFEADQKQIKSRSKADQKQIRSRSKASRLKPVPQGCAFGAAECAPAVLVGPASAGKAPDWARSNALDECSLL
jgi:hypothetical protein